MNYDTWLLQGSGCDDVEYDYDQYEDLPCEWVQKLNRWRDVETNLIVSDREAFRRNDAECERQEECKRMDDKYRHLEDY